MNIAKLYLTLAAVLFVSPSLIAQTSARYIFDGDAIATSKFSVTISGQTAQVAQYVTRLHVMGTGEPQPEDLQIFFTVKRNNALTIRQCDSWFKRVSGSGASVAERETLSVSGNHAALRLYGRSFQSWN